MLKYAKGTGEGEEEEWEGEGKGRGKGVVVACLITVVYGKSRLDTISLFHGVRQRFVA